MNMPKLTPAQTWLVHTLETLFLGAVVDGSINVYQSIVTGNYDWKSLLGIFGTAFIAVLTKGSANSIKNNANLLPAIHDTVAELPGIKNTVDQLLTHTIASNAQANAVQAPLVVVHATEPSIQHADQTEKPTSPQPLVTPPMSPAPLSQMPVNVQRTWSDSTLIPVVKP